MRKVLDSKRRSEGDDLDVLDELDVADETMRVLVQSRSKSVRKISLSVDRDVLKIFPVGSNDVNAERVLAELADVLRRVERREGEVSFRTSEDASSRRKLTSRRVL